MTHKPVRFEQAALDTILDALLAEHPDAFVAAIDPEPGGRFVPIPASLQLRGPDQIVGDLRKRSGASEDHGRHHYPAQAGEVPTLGDDVCTTATSLAPGSPAYE
jgi:hypothetical protein